MTSKLRSVLIMAGGTGGHVFPALAVAKALRAKGVDVQWLGTKQGIESRLIPEAGFPLHTISIGGLRGKGWKTILLAPVRLGAAILQSLKIIRQLNPDVVLGFGGFASGPGGIASRLLGKKLVIHEQNAKAGMTNKWLARVANKVLEGFPDTFKQRHNVVTTGNPVRKEIAALGSRPSPLTPLPQESTVGEGKNSNCNSSQDNIVREEKSRYSNPSENAEAASFPTENAEAASLFPSPTVLSCGRGGRGEGLDNTLHLLVLGGSLGAAAINLVLPRALAKIPEAVRPHVYHQTGEKHFTDTLAAYQQAGVTANSVPFITEMDKAYAWADVVLCRAGASTVAELCAAGLGAILVPFPHAVDDHQTANANFMVNGHAAILIQQADLNETVLANLLQEWGQSKDRCRAMGEAAYHLRQIDATEKVVTICEELGQ